MSTRRHRASDAGPLLGPDRSGETFTGTNGDNRYTGTAGDDTIITKLGNDGVDGAGGYDTLIIDHSRGDPQYGGGGEINAEEDGSFSGSIGSGGSKTYFSRVESIVFTGCAADDEVYLDASPLALGNAVNLDGGSGFNTLRIDYRQIAAVHFAVGSDGSISSSAGKFTAFQQFDLLLGSGSNSIRLGTGSDSVYGGVGASRIITGAGDDEIVSYGIDQVDGGAGNDRWSFVGRSHTSNLSFTLGGFAAAVSDGTSARRVEDVTIYGGDGNDTFELTGRRTYRLSGGLGSDTLLIDDASTPVQNATYYVQVNYDGTLYGSATGTIGETFRYVTFDGLESVNLTASAGDDQVSVAIAPSRFNVDYKIDGGAGSDVLDLDLNSFNQRFDIRVDQGGAITTSQGDFHDFESFFIAGGLKGLRAQLGGGDDTIEGSVVRDHLGGGGGIDHLNGNGSDDLLAGREGDDVLNGGLGDDVIRGGAGDDEIFGDGFFDSGRDVLTGGRGADMFIFNSVRQSPAGGGDEVTDFSTSERDKINLLAIDANISSSEDDAFTFIGTRAFGGHAGELREAIVDGVTFLRGDVDGDGHADLEIRLDGQLSLSATDLIL